MSAMSELGMKSYWQSQVQSRDPELPKHKGDHLLNHAEALLKQTLIKYRHEWHRLKIIADKQGTYGYLGEAYPSTKYMIIRARRQLYGDKDSTELEVLREAHYYSALIVTFLADIEKIYVFKLSDISENSETTYRFGKNMRDFSIHLGKELSKFLEEDLGWNKNND